MVDRLQEAAPDLYAACRLVVEQWESGDLAEAVRECAFVVAQVDEE